jgi:hypothetical protein
VMRPRTGLHCREQEGVLPECGILYTFRGNL